MLRFTGTFCSYRNLSVSICHSASIRAYLPVTLCSTIPCRQLVEIRSQVRPFQMQCVCLVRLDPIEQRIRVLFTVTWQAVAENHVLQFSTSNVRILDGFRHHLLGHVTSSSRSADLFWFSQSTRSDHHTVLDED